MYNIETRRDARAETGEEDPSILLYDSTSCQSIMYEYSSEGMDRAMDETADAIETDGHVL
jgi:hypothetical protein